MTGSRVIRSAAAGWAGVEPARYKEEGEGPGCFLGATRHTLLGAAADGPGASLDFELRYFELAPGGYSSLERHEHPHAVVVLRGRGTVRLGEIVEPVGPIRRRLRRPQREVAPLLSRRRRGARLPLHRRPGSRPSGRGGGERPGEHGAMKVAGVPYRAIFTEGEGTEVRVIDQTLLPHRFETIRLDSTADAARAIRDMVVRGAPLIGATAAYGVALAMRTDPSDASLDRVRHAAGLDPAHRCQPQVGARRSRGAPPPFASGRARSRGLRLRRPALRGRRAPQPQHRRTRAPGSSGRSRAGRARAAPARELNVMTHCNAGWLATVDWGTATAPMYLAHDQGLPVHVWVRETRPRFQGAGLTAWELGQHGVPHTLVSDSAAGHLLSRGKVDLVIVGTDRTTAGGDVANKVGTYPLALAARDNGVPFYVAAPSPSIDWSIEDGAGIPIEQRDPDEVTRVWGVDEEGVERQREGRAAGHPGRQLRLRRDAEAAGDGTGYGKGGVRGGGRSAQQDVRTGHLVSRPGNLSAIRAPMHPRWTATLPEPRCHVCITTCHVFFTCSASGSALRCSSDE